MDKEHIAMIAREVAKNISSSGIQNSITLGIAKKLAAAVEEKAKKIGVNAVVAVTDSSARPVCVECMDNSFIASYDIAMGKAYTVVALKMSTAALKGMSQPGGSLYGIQHTNGGKIVIFGGGDPLVYNSQIIGGLGVSGGSEEQDTALSAYGASILENIINS